MLAHGMLRVLSANDPDPYPDSVHVDLTEQADDDEDGGEVCFVSKATRRKKPTAIQKAVARMR